MTSWRLKFPPPHQPWSFVAKPEPDQGFLCWQASLPPRSSSPCSQGRSGERRCLGTWREGWRPPAPLMLCAYLILAKGLWLPRDLQCPSLGSKEALHSPSPVSAAFQPMVSGVGAQNSGRCLHPFVSWSWFHVPGAPWDWAPILKLIFTQNPVLTVVPVVSSHPAVTAASISTQATNGPALSSPTCPSLPANFPKLTCCPPTPHTHTLLGATE